MSAESKVPCQSDWIEPELRGEVVAIHVDVRRLVGLVAVELKTVWAGPQDGWHVLKLYCTRKCVGE